MQLPKIILLLILFLPTLSFSMEICNNGIDDDGDGLIDLNDEDCQCADVLEDVLFISNGDFSANPFCCQGNNFSRDDCLDNWVPVNGSPEHINPDCYADLEAEEASLGFPIDGNFVGMIYNDFASFEFKETFGICTNQVLVQDITYRIEFDVRFSPNPDNFDGEGSPHLIFYGLSDCQELAFTDGILGDLCELDFDLIPLDSVNFDEISPTEWRPIQRTFTAPEDVNAVIVGFECNPDGLFGIRRFVFVDNIRISKLLNQAFDFDLNVEPVGDLCVDDLSLAAIDLNDFDYQWYRDGIAIVGAETNTLNVANDPNSNGLYELLISNVDGCVVTAPIEVLTEENNIDTTLCLGTTLDITTGSFDIPGIYEEEIPSDFGCDKRVYDLDFDELIVGDTIVDSFQSGGSYSFGGEELTVSGIYENTVKNVEGCDSLVILDLAEIDFSIRLPNVFNPSVPGEERLTAYVDISSVEILRQLSVYDRWGNLLFDTRDIPANQPELGWDGRVNNTPIDPGVYVVYVEALFTNGETEEIWTTVSLIR